MDVVFVVYGAALVATPFAALYAVLVAKADREKVLLVAADALVVLSGLVVGIAFIAIGLD